MPHEGDHSPLRRDALIAMASGLCAAIAGCAEPRAPVAPRPLPPLDTGELLGLVPRAGLAWLVRARPRAIAEIAWLIPALGKVLPERRLDAFREENALDPRQVVEAVFARFEGATGSSEAQLVRAPGAATAAERRFRVRLTSAIVRAEDRPDLVRVSGMIGNAVHALARLGDDVVVFQQGGSIDRGPARIASLYARGALAAVPSALSGGPLAELVHRFGDAPLLAMGLGPFPEPWTGGLRGLLAATTAIGAGARPTAREHVGISLALVGAWGDDATAAADVLREAWGELARSTMGRLLGLDAPIESAVVAGSSEVLTLAIELDPNRLAAGLSALLERDLDAIMRL
jgi:hypothetical protein